MLPRPRVANPSLSKYVYRGVIDDIKQDYLKTLPRLVTLVLFLLSQNVLMTVGFVLILSR